MAKKKNYYKEDKLVRKVLDALAGLDGVIVPSSSTNIRALKQQAIDAAIARAIALGIAKSASELVIR